jgi:hypothetical protein
VSLLRATLWYASHFGWSSFPVGGKVPLTRHGFHDASTDPDLLEHLFADPDATGIGVACGASNLVVVDLDGEEGRDTWADLAAQHGGHGRTLAAETGTGLHIYFGGEGRSSCRKIGAGVDTRGNGGYVIAPPSVHPSGRTYRWRDRTAPLAPVPAWLAVLLEPPPPPLIVERRELKEGICATAYGRGALLGLAEEMLATPEGERNERLVRLAYRAGRLSAGGELDVGAAADVLLEAAVRTGLSHQEALMTIASGIAAGERYPLVVTDER